MEKESTGLHIKKKNQGVILKRLKLQMTRRYKSKNMEWTPL
jgi:hypothetical protein